MPLDPSVLLKVQYPQYPDPVEDYKGFLSLRQMMDLGKLRQVQLRQEELDNQAKQQALTDAANLRAQAGSLGPDSSLADYVRVGGPTLGTKLYTEQRQAQTAAFTQNKAREELRDKLRDEYLNGLSVIAKETDPVGKQAMHTHLNETLRERARTLGIPNVESMMWPKPPADEAAFKKGFESAYGPVKTQEWLDKQREAGEKIRKAAAEEFKDHALHAGMTLGAVANQDQWTGEINSWPADIKMHLKPSATYSPEEKRRVEMGLTNLHDRLEAESRGDTVKAQKITGEDRMRDDYLQQSKNFINRRDYYKQMLSGAQSGTGVGDLAVVFGYMKLLEPTSAVMGGEREEAQKAGGLYEQLKGLYTRMLTTGETLTPKVKKDFVDQAGKLYQQFHADQQKLTGQFRDLAVERGFNPRSVVIDLDPATPGVQTEAPAGGASTAAAASQGSGPTRFVPLQEVMPGLQPTGTPPPKPQAQTPQAAPANLKPHPKVGDVIEGDDGKYVYAGGDPKSKQSYRKISGKK